MAELINKFARMGEFTSIVMMISPLPSFISCHRKSFEKVQMLDKVNFPFLILCFICNSAWLSFGIATENMDIVVVNSLSTMSSLVFLFLYMYIKNSVRTPFSEMALVIPALFIVHLIFSSFFAA